MPINIELQEVFNIFFKIWKIDLYNSFIYDYQIFIKKNPVPLRDTWLISIHDKFLKFTENAIYDATPKHL